MRKPGEPEYTIGRLKGVFQLVWYDRSGARRRYSLNTTDARQAKAAAPALYTELTRPTGTSLGALWDAYVSDHVGRAILERMVWSRKAIEARFWLREAESITKKDCEAHIAERREAGVGEWTIYTELSHISNVCSWAEKSNLIKRAPHIHRPPQPKPKEDKHLTRDQVKVLVAAAEYPHVKLAIILLYTTAARSAALRGLVWQRVDFEREQIDLRDPMMTQPHKGRAIVPMLRTTKEALLEAQRGALSAYVIEWGGRPVKSLKRGVHTAARLAGIKKQVTPHVLRHSAAVHMAESGIPMEEIAQFLGHDDVNTTRTIYARFSPGYLKEAARALEL
jgi:integrase